MIFFSSVTNVAGAPLYTGYMPDGLTSQPVDVKRANGVERRLALAAGAEDKQDLAAGVRSDRSGLRFRSPPLT